MSRRPNLKKIYKLRAKELIPALQARNLSTFGNHIRLRQRLVRFERQKLNKGRRPRKITEKPGDASIAEDFQKAPNPLKRPLSSVNDRSRFRVVLVSVGKKLLLRRENIPIKNPAPQSKLKPRITDVKPCEVHLVRINESKSVQTSNKFDPNNKTSPVKLMNNDRIRIRVQSPKKVCLQKPRCGILRNVATIPQPINLNDARATIPGVPDLKSIVQKPSCKELDFLKPKDLNGQEIISSDVLDLRLPKESACENLSSRTGILQPKNLQTYITPSGLPELRSLQQPNCEGLTSTTDVLKPENLKTQVQQAKCKVSSKSADFSQPKKYINTGGVTADGAIDLRLLVEQPISEDFKNGADISKVESQNNTDIVTSLVPEIRPTDCADSTSNAVCLKMESKIDTKIIKSLELIPEIKKNETQMSLKIKQTPITTEIVSKLEIDNSEVTSHKTSSTECKIKNCMKFTKQPLLPRPIQPRKCKWIEPRSRRLRGEEMTIEPPIKKDSKMAKEPEYHVTYYNAFTHLIKAKCLKNEALMNACQLAIDRNTSAAVMDDGFLQIDLDTLCYILRRDTLNISEIKLFDAICRWSEAECKRKGLPFNTANQQDVLGGALSLIRYPLMSLGDFSSRVALSRLLPEDDVIALLHYLKDETKPSLCINFDTRPRNSVSLVASRFRDIKNGWTHSGLADRLGFYSNRDIQLKAFMLFSSETKNEDYTITIKLIESFSLSVVYCNTVSYKTTGTTLFIAELKYPVKLSAFMNYTSIITTTGPDSYYGDGGMKSNSLTLGCGDSVTITYNTDADCPNNRTTLEKGQIAGILFTV